MSRCARSAYFAWLLALAGCATQQSAAPVVQLPTPVVVDSFCETARKRGWSIKDTAQSIAEARAWNRAIDKRCGLPRSA
jgi:hypothetical protein